MTYTPFPPIQGTKSKLSSIADPRNIVSMRQARLALFQTPCPNTAYGANLMDATTYLLGQSTDQSLILWWEYSPTVVIDDPIVYRFGQMLGVTQQNAEDLFTLAASL